MLHLPVCVSSSLRGFGQAVALQLTKNLELVGEEINLHGALGGIGNSQQLFSIMTFGELGMLLEKLQA
jgi:hypothetical protein